MKATWVDGDEEGNLYIKLTPADDTERNLICSMLSQLTGSEPGPASMYGEPDKEIWAVPAGPNGEVLTGPDGESPRLELRIF